MEVEKFHKLSKFKKRNKFSTNAWKGRGLIPSNDQLCKFLTNFFNSCADKLVEGLNNKLSEDEIKYILEKELASLRKLDFDTEEKEFICDLFQELASFVKIEFNEVLEIWLYGYALKIPQKEIVEILKQPCTNCGIELETYINEKQEGIPAYGWGLAKCNNCDGLNLLNPRPNVKQASFGNYQWFGTLYKDKYNSEQALAKLEKIKLLKKLDFKMSW
jgi:hypothetical protein